MSEETAVVEEPVKAAKSGTVGKMLMIVVLTLLSSAGGGFASFWMMSRAMNKDVKADKEAQDQEHIVELLEKSAVLPLEPFVVNLADTDGARYLRMKISLMVDKEKSEEAVENQALQLKVRDVILQSLTAKTSHDLRDETGKDKLRHELQEKLSLYFKEPKLVEVMFTEFVIQL